MANILYLVHRMPYPPNKGDKVRSYHLLTHLVQRHRVFVGTFIDDPDDAQHIPALKALCADLCVQPLSPRTGKLRSLTALAHGGPLTLRYYRDAGLARWVAQTVARERIDAVLVFSSSMAQYAEPHPQLPLLADLVDVDSAKWTEYAQAHRWPMSWLYRREGRTLLAYERQVVQQARQSFLVTDKEVALFEQLAPDCRGRVADCGNGVDAEFFSPDAARPSPYPAGQVPVVFTGAMDYWPNVDAVRWFAQEVMPLLRVQHPGVHFHIVGRAPTAEVQALAGPDVHVAGTVPDVRPYLQHAAVVVAPLRLARGVQNKVLEAMAMGRPVVAAEHCVAAIAARPGLDVCTAQEPAEWAQQTTALLRNPVHAAQVGATGRQCVLDRFSWPARLAGLDRALAQFTVGAAASASASAPAPAPAPAPKEPHTLVP